MRTQPLTHEQAAMLEAARCIASGQAWPALAGLTTALRDVPALWGSEALGRLVEAVCEPINVEAERRRRWLRSPARRRRALPCWTLAARKAFRGLAPEHVAALGEFERLVRVG